MAENDDKASYCRFLSKLTIISIVVGITIFLLFDMQETQLLKRPTASPLTKMELDVQCVSKGNVGQCDLFNGEWVPNPSGPSYTNSTCSFIDVGIDCLKNGRLDTGYLYWSWKPHDCDLRQLDAKEFMSSMRHKSWAFIGDSIVRNQMQSMTCMLSKVEEPVKIYHDVEFKSSTFYFPSHNLTIATIWTPFLVKYDTNKSTKEYQVYLDLLEEMWATTYHKYDYIVIATGQWYTKSFVLWEQGKITGCHNCKEDYKQIQPEYPYRKALETAFNFITSSDHKPFVFFRTWMSSHFEYGEWFSGGICNRTRPYKEGEYAEKLFDRLMRNIEMEEFEEVVEVGEERGIRMELLDIFHLSWLRPDGHPGPYGKYHPFDEDKDARVQNDCLHSCLPGPIDTWNDLIMKKLQNAGVIEPSERKLSM